MGPEDRVAVPRVGLPRPAAQYQYARLSGTPSLDHLVGAGELFAAKGLAEGDELGSNVLQEAQRSSKKKPHRDRGRGCARARQGLIARLERIELGCSNKRRNIGFMSVLLWCNAQRQGTFRLRLPTDCVSAATSAPWRLLTCFQNRMRHM